jgi:hypothetical protein
MFGASREDDLLSKLKSCVGGPANITSISNPKASLTPTPTYNSKASKSQSFNTGLQSVR